MGFELRKLDSGMLRTCRLVEGAFYVNPSLPTMAGRIILMLSAAKLCSET